MKNLWALRSVLGLLYLFGLAVTLFVWALAHYPVYVGAAIIILILLIVANQPRVRKERERTQKLVDAAFQDAYAQLYPPPSIVRSYSYGYPAFEIKFSSKFEMHAAASRNDLFKVEIGKIFKAYGPRHRPFSADQAIFFTYHDHLDELRVQ
jgi:asparagine N-glycosylation enzyme membrane subunit Stt3